MFKMTSEVMRLEKKPLLFTDSDSDASDEEANYTFSVKITNCVSFFVCFAPYFGEIKLYLLNIKAVN